MTILSIKVKLTSVAVIPNPAIAVPLGTTQVEPIPPKDRFQLTLTPQDPETGQPTFTITVDEMGELEPGHTYTLNLNKGT